MDHILVVEDDAAIRSVLVLTLEMAGYAVVTAQNGAEALTQIAIKRPTLVLLDMHMPQMDGWQFKQALRDRQIDLPIVVMTAAVNAAAYASDIAAAGFLRKPFDIDDLLDLVERVLA